MAAFSSLPLYSPPLSGGSFGEAGWRGLTGRSMSREGRVEEGPDPLKFGSLSFSESGGGGGGGDWERCFSAMAETAASTFCSNSSSVMVSVVRSMFSMNWMAPICGLLARVGRRWVRSTDQRRQIVPGLSAEFLLVPESQDVLDIRDEVLWIRVEHDVDEHRHKRVGGPIRLGMLKQAWSR